MEIHSLSIPQLIVSHPSLLFIFFSSCLAFIALGPSPRFIPLVLLIATLQIYIRIVVHRQYALIKLCILWLFLTLSVSVTHATLVFDALSTPTYAFISFIFMAGLTTLIALAPVLIDIAFCMHVQSSWSQLAFFPTVWATSWWLVSCISPIGRLATWSPVQGLGIYDWLIPYSGIFGIDFMVGAWSVILSQAIGMWIMGTDSSSIREEQETAHLIFFDTLDDNPIHEDRNNSRQDTRRSHKTVFLAIFLALLSLPALQTVLPLPTHSSSTSMLSVACALPFKSTQIPTLSDYISETQTLAKTARIILWPEGAVRFDSLKEKEEAIELVRNASDGSLIGVAFEEYLLPGLNTRSGIRQNGIMFIDKHRGVVSQYFKRNLVPLVESYPMMASTNTPTIFDFTSNDRPKQSLTLTTSICLDFATMSPFMGLEERPALILAPARTWEKGIGVAMWDQARIRAAELDSTLLWCDGGAGGVSGVAGRGMSEVVQYGQGSWVKRIGIELPFNRQRQTLYARAGNIFALCFAWTLFGGVWVFSQLEPQMVSRIYASATEIIRRFAGGGDFTTSTNFFAYIERRIWSTVRYYWRAYAIIIGIANGGNISYLLSIQETCNYKCLY